MRIRCFRPEDGPAVIALWRACGLAHPNNDPEKDIARKLAENPELFFVGEVDGRIRATCMAGYDGHRGSIFYLGVDPELQGRGLGSAMVLHAEETLLRLGCPKINLMVRASNTGVLDFYRKQGYADDPVVVVGKRLVKD